MSLKRGRKQSSSDKLLLLGRVDNKCIEFDELVDIQFLCDELMCLTNYESKSMSMKWNLMFRLDIVQCTKALSNLIFV